MHSDSHSPNLRGSDLRERQARAGPTPLPPGGMNSRISLARYLQELIILAIKVNN